jgi:hypothetical protein
MYSIYRHDNTYRFLCKAECITCTATCVYCCMCVLLHVCTAACVYCCMCVLLHACTAACVYCCMCVLLHVCTAACVYCCMCVLLQSHTSGCLTVETSSCDRLVLSPYMRMTSEMTNLILRRKIINFLIGQCSCLMPSQKLEGKLLSLKSGVLHVSPCCAFSNPTASKYGTTELVYSNMS